MKLPRDARPDLIADARDPMRPVLNSLLLEIDGERKARLIATDGRMMLFLPVEVAPDDVAGLIPKAAFELAADPARRTELIVDEETGDEHESIIPIELGCGDGMILVDEHISLARPKYTYPNYKTVLDSVSGEPIVTITLNAELLAKLQKGMGATAVKLEIFGPLKSIRVTSGPFCEAKDAIGYLMPVRTS